jgi:hypothetical protein
MRSSRRGDIIRWALVLGSALVFAPSLGGPDATASGIIYGAGERATPLATSEEVDPRAAELARTFNPAMALPAADAPWPVAVSYAWSDGADLMARARNPAGEVVSQRIAASNQLLRGGATWGDLASRDAQGRELEYFIDAPGDDSVGGGATDSAWRVRWRELAGREPDRSAFPPTQYAHLFWLDRQRGLLVVQYWFFFPFNEWINHHEGDWEHVNVILQGPSDLADHAPFRAVGQQYFFHGWRCEPARTVRVTGAGGDHLVIFTGGRGQFLWWRGRQSGGSYPWPARFHGVGGGLGPFRSDDDTRHPGRFLPAEAFQVVLLPEPSRLDTGRHPELSWLRLRFFAGQSRVTTNPPLTDWLGGGGPPLQPGVRRDWNSTVSRPRWLGRATLDGAPDADLPPHWRATR